MEGAVGRSAYINVVTFSTSSLSGTTCALTKAGWMAATIPAKLQVPTGWSNVISYTPVPVLLVDFTPGRARTRR